ncbi:MAG: L-threonylcarbamoyladenylate synthase [Firmicutes bacterium]|nr:L-threonylcarbamoyladenylate synthase [Bacillota bacterium]MDD4693588.1 L-threonylcarbamoyladenylate synthase [Bacillota bacterium]
METKIFFRNQLDEAATLLKAGHLVAFPTETVYGLGADALNPEAVLKIFAAKGRPADNPLIVHVKEAEDALGLAFTNAKFYLLAKTFWPGPLTMVLPRKPIVPNVTTGGLDTVALRCPRNTIALELIAKANTPLAAPSANRSGRPSPTEAFHVLEDMKGIIAGVVDGGHTGIGLESTVLDLTTDTPQILRPGGVTLEMLREVLPETDFAVYHHGEKVKSPGLKYKHYAPKAPVYRVFGEPEKQLELILEQIKDNPTKKIGVLATSEYFSHYPTEHKISLGSRKDPMEIAGNLYSALRYFDSTDVEYILAETITGAGLKVAINDRLDRASGGRTLEDFLQDIRR